MVHETDLNFLKAVDWVHRVSLVLNYMNDAVVAQLEASTHSDSIINEARSKSVTLTPWCHHEVRLLC